MDTIGIPTRETLLKRVRDPNDEASWGEFCRLYRGFIFGVCKGMGVSHHDAEDVTQRVLLKIWKHLRKFDYKPERGRFRSWLGTVTSNLVRTYAKEPGRRHLPVADENLSSMIAGFEDVEPETAAMIEREWKLFVSDLAWENIQKDLSDSVRDVFLAMMKGMPAKDVAARFGLKENTVYVHRQRVVHRLQREIRRLEDDLG